MSAECTMDRFGQLLKAQMDVMAQPACICYSGVPELEGYLLHEFYQGPYELLRKVISLMTVPRSVTRLTFCVISTPSRCSKLLLMLFQHSSTSQKVIEHFFRFRAAQHSLPLC